MKPYLIISFGMLVYAFAATGFLVPHKIVGGGATGIATVLFYLFKIPVGIGYFLVNILLLIIAMKVLGPKFGIKTIFAIIVGSVFLGIMQPLMPVDGILPDEKFMSTIIAAMLTGIGIGVSLSVGGSTGGTDIIAMLVTKYHNVSPGRVLMYVISVSLHDFADIRPCRSGSLRWIDIRLCHDGNRFFYRGLCIDRKNTVGPAFYLY
mgnify:CR=1 FL=1